MTRLERVKKASEALRLPNHTTLEVVSRSNCIELWLHYVQPDNKQYHVACSFEEHGPVGDFEFMLELMPRELLDVLKRGIEEGKAA